MKNTILFSNKPEAFIFLIKYETFLIFSGKPEANLGTLRCMSSRFCLIGSITLISQWAIMLNVIIIKARASSRYYPRTHLTPQEAVTTAE